MLKSKFKKEKITQRIKKTIEKLISIQQYQNFNYSIRKTAYEINQSKTTIHRIYKMLVAGLTPI
ncbi:hypothetical protein [Spiroplasma endosymbiont of Polydrusus pterygomalis]|uniref:hypothetical protein n=1 Tax=Spiroplasma endosymbiont of Polydrusus pterygomalis TaxID=3139327 RepID=UPI003CCB72EF